MSSQTAQPLRTPPAEALEASRRTLTGLAVFSLFINILMLTGPLYMLQVYDRVLASSSIPTLLSLTLLVVVLYGTLGILDWCRQSLFSVVASRFEGKLADPAMRAAIQFNLAHPGQSGEGALRDLRTVRRFIASPVLPAVFDAPFTPLFLIVLFMMHSAFGIWALVGGGVLIGLALINQSVNRVALKEAEVEEQQATRRATEALRHVEAVNALGMRERMIQRWRAQFDASDAALGKSSESLGGFTAATKAFRLFLQSGILGLGAWLAIEGQSTPGAMIAASILMGRAIAPIEQVVGQWRSLVQARTSWESLTKALTDVAKADIEAPMELPPLSGRIDIENIIAAPPGSRTPVLRNVKLSLEPGECLGVIGPSASGKSTFARILSGVWPAQAGVVRLDGADIRGFSPEQLGPQIGYMPQQVDLFSGTVRENISRFVPDANPEDVIAAAQAANCHELILRLPNGYDTEIGERGAFLSAGQRQRVGLARALYGSPAIVILDEPNSNLDSEGDTALQNAIAGLKQRGATVIIIAHRPNAIVHCNSLMVLDQGQVKLQGPRDEVLAQLNPQQPVNAPGRVTALRKEPGHG